VHTATGDRTTDNAVALAADRARTWCVRADDASASAAWTPAVARTADGVLVAVSGGGDPGRSRAIRDAVAVGLDTGELPVRATRRRLREGPGTVHLVGGGPGHDELITVRGRRLLATADVVVVDRLAPRGLLERLSPDVEVIDCGKTPGHHQLTQDQINAVIVERALAGLDVVRLKGGDPFVLGRGGEEALACHLAGVPVAVVPGVTSAVSVPAAAGIPVTHRGVTSSFALVSAHDGVEPIEQAAREHAPTTTLVLLMGVRLLRGSAEALVASGRAPSTPVAIVERGWTSTQRTTVGTLADIADLAEARGVESPAVVVVGDVVSLRAELGPFAAELG
jgi:uroporphyrin-III C-methyltransferase/precorrin-2 dehydrogenase/sirohydrochlorin ferrochelatase